MKSCLIIASPRSGSTNLMRSIAKGNNLKECFEPFGHKTTRRLKIDNYCTKVIARRKSIEYWIELANKFDKFILLSRRDITASGESLTKLAFSHGPSKGNPDLKWSKLTEEEAIHVKKYTSIVEQSVKVIEMLSILLDTHINYYEDVYSSFSLRDDTINLDTSYLDISRKSKIEHRNVI